MTCVTYSPRLPSQAEIEREIQRREVRASLARYVELTMAEGFRLEHWQHRICERLQRLPFETGQRLLIHGPPQFGKSLLISQRLPAWMLGMRPDARIRLACYNQS